MKQLPFEQHGSVLTEVNITNILETTTSQGEFSQLYSCVLGTSKRNRRTVFSLTELVHVPAQGNGTDAKTPVHSGASITVINKNMLPQLIARRGNSVIVYGYGGKKQLHDKWADILITCQGNSANVKELVLYELLLSSPVMQTLRTTFEHVLRWTNYDTRDRRMPAFTTVDEEHLKPVAAEDIIRMCPEVLRVCGYPKATLKFQVPFQVRDTTVKRKARNMSREKKLWLELQKMLDASAVQPSTSTFTSPISISLKEDRNFRLCTDYRQINKQADLFPFLMRHINKIINENGRCKVFCRLDLLASATARRNRALSICYAL